MKARSGSTRVRARGPLSLTCRLSGVVVTLLVMVGFLRGRVGWFWVAPGVGVGVIWQLLLLRPGVLITDSVVSMRGILATRDLPISQVRRFTVRRRALPLDQFANELNLAAELDDGSEVATRWIAWQDLLSPWMAGQRSFPTPRQRRVIEKLGADLLRRSERGDGNNVR